MRLLVTLEQFWNDVRAQKLRTILTVLGITWGTVSVVVLLAFGVGLERQSRKSMHGMGDGIVVMFPGTTTKVFEGYPDGRPVRFREDDVRVLEREVSDIEAISPEYTNGGTPVRLGKSSTTPLITGVYPIYGDLRNIIAEPGGRFLNDQDLQHRRRVAVLGDEIRNLLFGGESAVGKQVMVGETPFVVIGVMEKKTQNSSYNRRDSERLFIPASTHQAVFGDRYLNNIIYRPTSPAVSETVEAQVFQTMGRKLRFDPTDEDAMGIWDTGDADKFMSYFFIGFNLFMGIIGSFTLTVGGIGVANIMYVVVRERTREVGIKRSVGARRRDILFQFFMEAFVIVFAGATFGFVISFVLVELLGMLPIQEFVGTPTVSLEVAGVTMALLALIAVLSGYFPARKAAMLDPVECLRA
jgi:putative ABC transport system permease protein